MYNQAVHRNETVAQKAIIFTVNQTNCKTEITVGFAKKCFNTNRNFMKY